ncbi:MAG: extracellular solute-binding protein [Corynebacterium sp.]|nr:extracellular solute-binding protein [Corynebacterium sp.]
MKRTVLATLATTLVAALTLTACSSTNTASKDNVELTVWTSQEDQTNNGAWLQTMQTKFAEAHPELKISWKNSVVSAADAATTVSQDPAAAADVYLFANDQLGSLLSSGAIGQLSDSGEKLLKEYDEENLINSVKGTDGNYYGLPYEPNTWFLYYDKSKLSTDDVKSFDTMLEKAKVSFPMSDSWYISAFYAGAGATYFGANGLDEAAGIKAGDKATDVTKYLVQVANNPNFINDHEGAGLGSLGKGVDVVFTGAWNAENAKKALGDNFGVAEPPMFNLNGQDTQLKAFSGSKAVAYNPNTKNPQVAAMFSEFLASTDSQKIHYEKNGVIPADKTLASDPTISADPVAIAIIETVTNDSILQPAFKQMTNYWKPAENFGKAIVNHEVTDDNAAEKTDAWFNAYK